MAVIRKVKQYLEIAKDINKVELSDGSIISMKVLPKFNPKKTAVGIEFSKNIKEDDIEIIVKVNGEPSSFVSGINDAKFTCDASFTKRF